jgi:hypothetical protein
VRAGYGISNVPYSANSYNNPGAPGWAIQGFETSTDLTTPIFSLAQGAPSPLYPGAAQRTPDLLNGQSVNYFPYHTPMGYVQQWQLDVQHQFAGNFLADVAYVGSRGVHLGFGTDINQVPASLLGPGDAQQNRPYPQFSTITGANRNGFSFYNSLQMTARKQFASGFSFVTSYTWSKYMDTGTGSGANGTQVIDNWQNAYSPQANYGPSSNHMTHLWSGSILYELPVGKGKPFLNRGGVLNAITGGWQLSSILEFHSGIPFTPVMGTANLNGALSGSWYPNRVGNGTLSNPSINDWFDTNAFEQPAQYTFGNSGRNVLYGPGYERVDLALAKAFAIHLLGEQGKLQVRGEAFNGLNHTNFAQPNAQIGTAGAGIISSTAANNRQIQLGAILRF